MANCTLFLSKNSIIKNSKGISKNKKNTKALKNVVTSEPEDNDDGSDSDEENACDSYPEAC